MHSAHLLLFFMNQDSYSGRKWFAGGNGPRPAAISAGKQNATPVYFALHASNKTITLRVYLKTLCNVLKESHFGVQVHVHTFGWVQINQFFWTSIMAANGHSKSPNVVKVPVVRGGAAFEAGARFIQLFLALPFTTFGDADGERARSGNLQYILRPKLRKGFSIGRQNWSDICSVTKSWQWSSWSQNAEVICTKISFPLPLSHIGLCLRRVSSIQFSHFQ